MIKNVRRGRKNCSKKEQSRKRVSRTGVVLTIHSEIEKEFEAVFYENGRKKIIRDTPDGDYEKMVTQLMRKGYVELVPSGRKETGPGCARPVYKPVRHTFESVKEVAKFLKQKGFGVQIEQISSQATPKAKGRSVHDGLTQGRRRKYADF